MVDPDGAHDRRGTHPPKTGGRSVGARNKVAELGGDRLRRGALEFAASDRAAQLATVTSPDTRLRAKLQQRYQQLARRLKKPVTPLPTLSDVQCLGTIADSLTGGRATLLSFIQAAMLVGDKRAEAWWEVYASLTPDEREQVNLDEVSLAAGVPYATFIGMLATVNTRLGADTNQLVKASLTPTVLAHAATSAALIGEDGFPDRQMLLQGAGLVPVSKGHTTEVNVHASAQAAALAEASTGRLRFLDDVANAGDARETVQQRIIDGETEDS